ncbi:MAG TPA: hypothetical protein VNT57_07165 [Desulfobacteria bacterium]|nr:hypothetical protein [Desulfobacteria bacterium]
MHNDEFKNNWDSDVFKTLAKASLKAGGFIGYKDFYFKEMPCNGLLGFGMSLDNLVKLKYIKRVGTSCTLTEKGLTRYNELQGA